MAFLAERKDNKRLVTGKLIAANFNNKVFDISGVLVFPGDESKGSLSAC